MREKRQNDLGRDPIGPLLVRLAVPTMLGASAMKLVKFGLHFTQTEALTLILGMAVAFVVSILAIKFLMSYIKKHDFKVFGWYRIVLGVIVLIYFAVSSI